MLNPSPIQTKRIGNIAVPIADMSTQSSTLQPSAKTVRMTQAAGNQSTNELTPSCNERTL